MNPMRSSVKKAVPLEIFIVYNMENVERNRERNVEATVRSIWTKQQHGQKPALCFRGKTHALGIINDEDMIHGVELSLRDHDVAPLLQYGAEEYPVYKFITHIERIMESKPISPEALQLIRQWPNNAEDFGLDPIPDDEEPTITRKPIKPKGPNIIGVIASEMTLPPTKIRKFLRNLGFCAPYDNESKIRAALKKYK